MTGLPTAYSLCRTAEDLRAFVLLPRSVVSISVDGAETLVGDSFLVATGAIGAIRSENGGLEEGDSKDVPFGHRGRDGQRAFKSRRSAAHLEVMRATAIRATPLSSPRIKG